MSLSKDFTFAFSYGEWGKLLVKFLFSSVH